MKVSYPNAFGRRMAEREGRTRLGGDIFIHGKAISIAWTAELHRSIAAALRSFPASMERNGTGRRAA